MVSLISTLSNGARTEPPPDPCKPLSETWSGRELLPTSRVIPLDTDGVEGADVKVCVRLEAHGDNVCGRATDVKVIDAERGDVLEFRPEHRREAIRRALDLV